MARTIDPKLKESIAKVIGASMKLLYSPESAQFLESGLAGDAPVAEKLAGEVAGVLRIVDDRAKMAVPKQAMVPAAMFLIQDLADFAQSAMGIEVSEEDIVAAMKLCVEKLVAEYKSLEQQKAAQPAQQASPQQPAPQPVQAPQPQGLMMGAPA